MTETNPSIIADLAWQGDLRFDGRAGEAGFTLDSDGKAGVSPVQALALGLAGCMAIDVVHILAKGRQDLRGLRAHLTGWRAEEEPRRLTQVDLKFFVEGDVAPDKLERALALSLEKYCSVWHSLRQDIDFTVAFEIARVEHDPSRA